VPPLGATILHSECSKIPSLNQVFDLQALLQQIGAAPT
jgi:hypothetical protein